MKQTNSAVTMLLSAFDSLYRKAYVKGIAAAVALTAGLTAGAQAADNAFYDVSGDNLDAVTINKEVTMGDKAAFADDVTVVNGGSIVSVEDGSKHNLYITGTLELQAGSKINITGDAGGKGIWGSTQEDNVDATSALKATGAEITLKSSQIEMANVSLTDTKVTLSSNIGALTGKPRWAQNTMILAEGSAEDGTGIMTIAGNSTIDMGEGSQLTAAVFNLNDGTITMKGTGDLATAGNEKSSYIRTYVNGGKDDEVNGIANLNGGRIEVAEGKYGVINSARINLNGTTIVNNGTLDLGTWTKAATPVAGETDIESTGGSITNNGTLKINGDVEFAGGTVTNKGTLNVSGDVTVADSVFTSKGLFAAKDGSSTGKIVLAQDKTLEVTGDAEIDLVALGAFDADAGTFKNSAIAFTTDGTFKARNVVIDAESYEDSAANLDVDSLTVTAGDTGFTFNTGKTVTIGSALNFAPATARAIGDSAANDINVEGGTKLVFGKDGLTQGTADHDYNITSGSMNFVAGDWDVGAVVINDANTAESFKVSGADVTVDTLTVTDGTANVEAGSLSAGNFSVAAGAVVKLGGTEASSLTITSVDTADSKGVLGTVEAGNLATVTITAGALEDILADNSTTDINSSKWASGSVTFDAGSKVVVETSATFDDASAASTFVSKLANENNGLVDLGNATITSLGTAAADSFVTTSELAGLSNITVNSLKTATRVVADGETVSGGEWTGLATNAADGNIDVQGTTVLHARDDYFAYTYAGTETGIATGEADIKLNSAAGTDNLTLVGSGIVGDITGTQNSGENDDVLNFTGEGTVTAGAISVFDEVNVNSSVTAESVSATSLNVNQSLKVINEDGDASVSVNDFSVSGYLETDDLTVTAAAGTTDLGTVTGEIKAGEVTVAVGTQNTQSMQVNGLFTADTFTVTGDTAGTNDLDLFVGDAEHAGTFQVGKLTLNGGSLIVDPSYEENASVAAITNLDADGNLIDANGDKNTDAVNISGSLGIGQNSVVAIGADAAEARAVAIRLGYMNGGSMTQNNVGSMLYINNQYTVDAGKAIYIDSEGSNTAENGNALTSAVNRASNSFTMRGNSALVIGADITDELVNSEATDSVINFTTQVTAAANIDADDTSRVVFDSTELLGQDTVQLFGNVSVSGVTELADFEATITAANGLLKGEIDNTGKVTFSLDEENAAAALYNQSSPVKALTLEVVGNENGDYTVGEYDGVDYITALNAHNGGADIEQTARLATYAGAVQATFMAQQTSTDAVADRMGMASVNSALVYADNAQGGGLWLMPVYKNHDSDSFDAQGVDYGADIDLYGVALGADFTTDTGVRVGAYFNVGSGDADGQGVASDVSNDFDYFGLGLYAGMSFGNFGLTADAGFTQVSNDIEQSVNYHDIGKVNADTDTTAVTVGVKGEYKLATAFVDVIPHVGVRYTSFDMDSYDARVDGEVVATTSAETMTVFSIPFGVSLSKEIAAGDWTVKPAFDLTLTANTGDTELDTDTTFTGTNGLGLSTEVLDDFTYGGALGIQAKYGESLSLGVSASYVGSDNADEFGVTGDIRYMF